MPTAQMKGESPNCCNHRALPIPADGLYWGAVSIKSCLYVTHNATQRENYKLMALMTVYIYIYTPDCCNYRVLPRPLQCPIQSIHVDILYPRFPGSSRGQRSWHEGESLTLGHTLEASVQCQGVAMRVAGRVPALGWPAWPDARARNAQ